LGSWLRGLSVRAHRNTVSRPCQRAIESERVCVDRSNAQCFQPRPRGKFRLTVPAKCTPRAARCSTNCCWTLQPRPAPGSGKAYAAAAAGAEVREGFRAGGLVEDDGLVRGIKGQWRGGGEAEERARIVIGADGRNSQIAKAVGAAAYNMRPVLTSAYYAYWRLYSSFGAALDQSVGCE
jgi:hypothetical protein